VAVVSGEDEADQLASTAHADLVEHGFETVPHGVRGDVQGVVDTAVSILITILFRDG
jgi:hypothetical protein